MYARAAVRRLERAGYQAVLSHSKQPSLLIGGRHLKNHKERLLIIENMVSSRAVHRLLKRAETADE
jgi:hypothetical protein